MSIQVPTDDAAALQELRRELASDSPVTQLHPFDGEAVVQSVVVLTAAGLPVLRTWLRAQVDQRKTFRVVYEGTEFEGYTPDEVESLMQTLSSDVDADH